MSTRPLAAAAAAAAAAIALAGAAIAQTPAPSPGYETHVEANRPRMAIRELSKQELSAMRKAIGSAGRSEASLAAVRPYAEAGDVTAIRTMMEGYVSLRKGVKRAKGAPMASTEQGYTALQGLWAMALWRQGVTDRDVAQALDVCLKGDNKLDPDQITIGKNSRATIYSLTSEYDCGFDTRGTEESMWRLTDYVGKNQFAKQYKGQPWTLTFAERPLVGQGEVESKRFAAFLETYRGSQRLHFALDEAELKWAADYRAARPEAQAKWDDMLFTVVLDGIGRGYAAPAQGTWFWTYMEADPARQQRYSSAVSGWQVDQAADQRRFMATIANAPHEDRDKLAVIAKRERGEYAAAWWKRYNFTVRSWYELQDWCDVGITAACGPAAEGKRIAESSGDVPLPSTGSVAATGTPGDSTQALKDYNARVNAQNCARADLGAIISCNR